MFLTAQLMVVLGVAHFYQRRKKLKEERTDSLKNMFNPYASRKL